jgi:thioredoxin reductase
MKILIVGAGIGGLSAAISLRMRRVRSPGLAYRWKRTARLSHRWTSCARMVRC